MQLFKKSFFIIPVFLFYWIGGLGLNYGRFWTERDFIYESLHKMVRSGVLLPGYYIYPSFYHWPCLGWLGIKALSYPQELSQAGKVSVPDQVGKLPQISTAEDISPFQERLYAIIESAGYQKGVRWIFLGIAGLSMIWIYALVHSVTSSRAAGWLAQGLLLGSWHFMFHSRWVAVDAGVASFGILVVWAGYMALTKSSHNSKLRWLCLSSCAVGLAAGCKYPGGIFILAPLFVVWFGFSQWSSKDRILYTFFVCLQFVGTFILTTPAAILDAGRFWRQLIFCQQTYKLSGWGAQTVNTYGEHLKYLLDYILFVQSSPWMWTSFSVGFLAFIGALFLWKTDKRKAMYFLLIPAVYIFYFSTNRIFIVRNYLLLTPYTIFFAVCSLKFGCECLLKKGQGYRWVHSLACLFLILVALGGIFFNYQKAEQTHSYFSINMWRQFESFLLEHADEVYLSSEVRKNAPDKLKRMGQENEIRSKYHAVLSNELEALKIPAISFRRFAGQFGCPEVDMRYYPIWNKESIIILNQGND